MARKSDGTVYIDTKIDTSGIGKGMAETNKKLSAASRSLDKFGNTVKKTFSESNTANVGKSYQELQKEISKAEQKLDRLIEKQIRFVETGGNKKSRTMAGMEYDIEMARNTLAGLRSQLAKTSMEAPRQLGTMEKAADKTKRAFNGLNKTAKRSHYSILRMLGTSILFSTVFRAISVVTQGFAEGIGNLSQYSDEANASMSALKSSMTQLKNSFATAFMPLITAVTPALTNFISLISKATNYVGALFAALSGKTTYTKAIEVQEDYAASLDKTAQSAKDAQRYLSGLDEIQTYTAKQSGNALPEDMFTEESIETPVLNFAETLKSAFKNEDWESLGGYLSNGIVKGLNKLSDKLGSVEWRNIGEIIGNFLKGIEWGEVLQSVGSLIWNAINAAIQIYRGMFNAAPIETAILTAIIGLKFSGIGSVIASKITSSLSAYLAANGLSLGAIGIAVTLGIAAITWVIEILPGAAIDFGQWFTEQMTGQKITDEEYAEILKGTGMLPEDFAYVLENWWKTGSIITPEFAALFQKGFKHYISDPIAETWKEIQEKTALYFLGIVHIVKTKINVMIMYINKMLSSVVSGVNGMIDTLNALKIDIPDWFGGGTIGFNIGKITAPQIPYLATGAVIPPNAPFMAVLGDQKHGTNIEAPLDTIKQAVKEVVGNGGGGQYQFTAQINRRTLFEEMIDEARLRQTTTGRNPFELA